MPTQEDVSRFFSDVAYAYDRMNDVMSLGWHRFWKSYFVQTIDWDHFEKPITYVDMACGTGDILNLVYCESEKRQHTLTAFGIDPNPQMLFVAQERLSHRDIHWVCHYAEENLPMENHTMDLYTNVFGLRNIQDRYQALTSCYRALKKGKKAYFMEFCPPQSVKWGHGYRLYLKLLPWMGKLMAQNKEAYDYLAESICAFPSPQLIAMALTEAGFSSVSYEVLTGGIVAIYKAIK